jgi:tetratricopeptide (TPR) repeat protein
MALAYQQQRYTRFLVAGNQAVAERRFDSQAYAQASRLWFASQDRLLFNQGVLAYKAGSLPRAMDFFRQASQHTHNPVLLTQALYNMGVVLIDLQDMQGAAELLKTALRLNPQDTDAKFTLEQLYHIAQSQPGEGAQQVSKPRGGTFDQGGSQPLKQAPGLSQNQGEGSSGAGQGRSTPRPGI